MTPPEAWRPRVASLVYAFAGDEVLMLRRARPPHQGLWVAPGGKARAFETPGQAARREFEEEAGRAPGALCARGVLAESGARDESAWLVFIYTTEAARFEPPPCEEGDLAWLRFDQWRRWRIPESDAEIYRAIEQGEGGFLEWAFRYDQSENLAATAARFRATVRP